MFVRAALKTNVYSNEIVCSFELQFIPNSFGIIVRHNCSYRTRLEHVPLLFVLFKH